MNFYSPKPSDINLSIANMIIKLLKKIFTNQNMFQLEFYHYDSLIKNLQLKTSTHVYISEERFFLHSGALLQRKLIEPNRHNKPNKLARF
jgi:hypothetical protein